MTNNNVYNTINKILIRKNNQPLEMSLADLVDELDAINAIPKETSFQIKLALMHYDFMDKIY